MNIDLPDHTFNVKETVISVSVCWVNPFPTLYAKKLRVSNSLQSILGLITLNESYCLPLLTVPRSATPRWISLPTSFCYLNSATEHCMYSTLIYKTSSGAPKCEAPVLQGCCRTSTASNNGILVWRRELSYLAHSCTQCYWGEIVLPASIDIP